MELILELLEELHHLLTAKNGPNIGFKLHLQLFLTGIAPGCSVSKFMSNSSWIVFKLWMISLELALEFSKRFHHLLTSKSLKLSPCLSILGLDYR